MGSILEADLRKEKAQTAALATVETKPFTVSFDNRWNRPYCEYVKNITVTVDDETYRRARIKAAAQDTSVSALVKTFLADLASGKSEVERLKHEEQVLRGRIRSFRAADRLTRDEVHRRHS